MTADPPAAAPVQASPGWREVAWLLAAIGLCLIPAAPSRAVGAAILLLLPGFSLARRLPWLTSEFDRFWHGLATSLVLAPLALQCAWLVAPTFWNVTLALAAPIVLLSAVPCVASRGDLHRAPRRRNFLLIGLIAWTAGWVGLQFVAPQLAGRTVPIASHDYVKHHAVLLALDQGRLPLHSPFYAAAPDEPYYYYHLYYLWPAALRRLSGAAISHAAAFGLYAALLAASFVAVIFSAVRSWSGSAAAGLLAATCVSIVGGWDAIPTALHVALGRAPAVVLDSWIATPWRIHNLATQFLWCPQHVAGLLMLIVAGCWWQAAPRHVAWILLAPLAAASIFWGSAFIALAAFPAAALLVLIELRRVARARDAILRRYAGALALIAGLAALLILPQFLHYRTVQARIAGGFTTDWERCPQALLGRLLPPGPLANYLDLPWIVFIDLGLGAVALLLVSRVFWRRSWEHRGFALLLLTGLIGVIGMFTVHDRAHDFVYGFRVGVMALSAFAAVAAGALLVPDFTKVRSRRATAAILAGGLALGAPIGFFELPMMALRTWIQRPSIATEQAAIDFARTLPADAVIQPSPRDRVALLQLVERRFGVADPANPHVQVFTPSDRATMVARCDRIESAFRTTAADAARDAFLAANVDYVWLGPPEREMCGDCAVFANSAAFERVFSNAATELYRVRPAVPPTSAALPEE